MDENADNQDDTLKLPPVQPQGSSDPQAGTGDDSSGSTGGQYVDAPLDQSQGGLAPAKLAIPDEAGDVDLIEKEWVNKAKEIVDHNSDDPHLQAAEIARVKAEYMKKRYNKDVEL